MIRSSSHNFNDRSFADEIIEGVLLAAQREYQEKKLPLYGNLLTNIAFRSDIDRVTANRLCVVPKG